MRFLEFFNKTPKAQPIILEPPPGLPGSVERKKKEELWFKTLNSKSKPSSRTTESEHASATITKAKGRNGIMMGGVSDLEQPVVQKAKLIEEREINSSNLATKLSNLSIAHQEGLIDDTQYRLLRSEAFKPFSGSSNASNLLKVVDDGGIKQLGSAYSTEISTKFQQIRPPTPPLTPPSQESVHMSPSSSKFVHSSRSDRHSFLEIPNKIFRRSSFLRSSRVSIIDESQASDTRSIASGVGGDRMERLHSRDSSNSSHHSLNRVRSLRNYPQLALSYSSRNGTGSIRDGGSETNTSIRSASFRESSYRDSRYDLTSQSGISESPSKSSVTQMRKYINPLPSSTDPFIFAKMMSKESSVVEMKLEIEEIELELKELISSWNSLEGSLEEKLAEGESVERQLVDIRGQRADSVKNYKIKLDYLNSRLRGAEIREGKRK